jgi:hypothetical protein
MMAMQVHMGNWTFWMQQTVLKKGKDKHLPFLAIVAIHLRAIVITRCIYPGLRFP